MISNATRFEFFGDNKKTGSGRAVFYAVDGSCILVLPDTLFENAFNINSAINKAERQMEIKIKQDLGQSIIDNAYD